MRIDYVSDLHLDNASRGGPHGWLGRADIGRWKAGGEVLVVAGDSAEHVDDMLDLLNAARDLYQAVVGVLGNHEMGTASRTLRDGVHILDYAKSNRVIVGNVGFIGACLAPQDWRQAEAIADSIYEVAQVSQVTRIVGVSHYPPTQHLSEALGLDLRQVSGHLLDAFDLPANAWVSGHLHLEFDLEVGGVRHVSNPRGYRGVRRDGTLWSGFRLLEV